MVTILEIGRILKNHINASDNYALNNFLLPFLANLRL